MELDLPKTEIVFDYKCVEAKLDYVLFVTSDRAYYAGINMQSALHLQTILAYEMNGKPLTVRHGQPLRLIIPVKYGIKNLKCIGTINFSNERTPDYWAKRGYDYYSGL